LLCQWISWWNNGWNSFEFRRFWVETLAQMLVILSGFSRFFSVLPWKCKDSTVVPPYPLIQYPRFLLSAVYYGLKKSEN
jgi:hypothetical protein